MPTANEATLLGRVAVVKGVAGYSHQNFPVDDLSVGRSVSASVCPVHCEKTAERVRMPFGIVGRTGPGMRQVVGFGDRSTGRGTFGSELGRAVVTKGDLTAYVCDSASTVGVAVCSDAALFPNYFGQTC